MDLLISPKYLMSLVDDIEWRLKIDFDNNLTLYSFYIKKWQQLEPNVNGIWQNFTIYTFEDEIDIRKTLHYMDGEILLKIAIDLGIQTPDFIPSVPVIKNDLKHINAPAYTAFEKALKQVEENPDIAIGLANAALESIIKVVLQDSRINIDYDGRKTLYALTQDILKSFHLFPSGELPDEIKTIGSSMMNINQSIERLRSEKTNVHGRGQEEDIIENPLYAYFIINSVTTVGLFIKSFYNQNFPKVRTEVSGPLNDDNAF